jgi:ABC-type Mn2+/Zn2+ transport system permease subunit
LSTISCGTRLPPPVWPPSYPDWWATVWGLIVFTVAAGIAMGLMGDRISGRDVAIGVVLALALGFGLLFLHYYTAFAAQATALLFGMDVRRRYPNSKDNC